jgi:AAA domain, putative AbiEii toxin, Type IV TA system
MLKRLLLENVGPAPRMELDLGSRLNIITGDNGLGKSFLLDVAWFVYTHHWPADINPKLTVGLKINSESESPRINADILHGETLWEQNFIMGPGRALMSLDGLGNHNQLAIYLMADGSCCIFDPYRNIPQHEEEVDTLPSAFIFSPYEILHGLLDPNDPKISLCEGLVRDLASWQKQNGGAFIALNNVLKQLSPDPNSPIKAGKLTRISVRDSKDMPTIDFGEQADVAIVHASSSMKRIVSFAYLLVWAWEEHLKAARYRRSEPLRDILFLIDEVDAHLHPSWQRKIVPTLLGVVEALLIGMVNSGLSDDRWHLDKAKELMGKVNVQIMTTTHSPLVMASLEPHFDAEKDKWFDLDLVRKKGTKPKVVLTDRPFEKMGDSEDWLTSDAFDLNSTRSIEAEKVLEKASIALSDEEFDARKAKRLYAELIKVLPAEDLFWTRWNMIGKKKGWWK